MLGVLFGSERLDLPFQAIPFVIRSQYNIFSGVLLNEHLLILMRGKIPDLTGGILSFFSDTDGQGVVVEQ